MKRMKLSMLSLIFFLSVAVMTGCRSRNVQNTTQPSNNAATGNSSMQQESTSMDDRTSDEVGTRGTNLEDRAGTDNATGGVIDGLMNDVERGVDDLREGTMEQTSDSAAETTR